MVELLVVIVILAILVTLGVVQYWGINSRARDSARRADIYEISIALEAHKLQQSYTPLAVSQFSSFQWADPSGDAYCISTGNPADPANTSAWGTTCPSGFDEVAPGVPAETFNSWKVCTFLELPAPPTANVFCRSSSQ